MEGGGGARGERRRPARVRRRPRGAPRVPRVHLRRLRVRGEAQGGDDAPPRPPRLKPPRRRLHHRRRREREWARRVADEKSSSLRLPTASSRSSPPRLRPRRCPPSGSSSTRGGSSGEKECGRARRWARTPPSLAVGGHRRTLGPSGPGGPNDDERGRWSGGSASKSRGAASCRGVRGEGGGDGRTSQALRHEALERKRSGPRRMPNSRLARGSLESARKRARLRAQGVGRARAASPGRRATSCPRRRPGRSCPHRVSSTSTRSLRPPGLFGAPAGSAPARGADPNPNPNPNLNHDPNDPGPSGDARGVTPGDAAIDALVDNLARRTAEAEKKLTRAENLAAGSQIGGSKVNVASGIAALKSRLARIAANSRRLTHASTSDGDGPSRKEAIAQLEQQERELASWFAELQSQLEALFARPKTARRSAVRSSWN